MCAVVVVVVVIVVMVVVVSCGGVGFGWLSWWQQGSKSKARGFRAKIRKGHFETNKLCMQQHM